MSLIDSEREPERDDEFHDGKIYCANCVHCKLSSDGLLIRCAAGKWKKRLGEEEMYKYSAIMRRCLDSCDAYDEMGDTREFMRELLKTLPKEE